ncbi:hypothetical protein [Rubellimicrobium aerolatum]|uniref:Pilus assembly protein PilP n=1 Tax=Rubellimicrobium aerolatum TaxID=490979 RepID=A0ABW0SCJ4_9RHOB|nr:hypothetical protein [Rubellimicrobium aerolatum]MBP1805911.1 hypothetical protein [Rubellimicrobium aerolatum]
MADTWDLLARLRPHLRPDGLGPERPRARPADLDPLVSKSKGHIPAAAESDATLRDALPLDRTALIGLLQGPQGNAALVRLASGAVVKVAEGQAVDGAEVIAIDERGLRLRRGREVVLLTMPS